MTTPPAHPPHLSAASDTTSGHPSEARERPRGTVRSTWPLYLLFFGVSGLVGGTIAYGFLGESLAALGIPDPGPMTTYGLPFFRAVGWMLAALSVGSFMFAAFFISPRVPEGDNLRLISSGSSVDGHIASRTGAVSALCFGLVAVLMIFLVLSDISGTPFVQTLRPGAFGAALSQVATAQAWSVVAIIALVTGGVGLLAHRWAAQPLLLLGSIAMIIPLALVGHSAAGGDHDYGTNSYLWHLVFLVVWVGGLMALLAHGRRLGPGLDTALRRYSTVALFSIIVMAVSGLVNAVIRIEFSDVFTTRYGLIIVAKTIGVVVLGVFGWLHRSRVIPKVQANPTDRGLFRQVAIGEDPRIERRPAQLLGHRLKEGRLEGIQLLDGHPDAGRPAVAAEAWQRLGRQLEGALQGVTQVQSLDGASGAGQHARRRGGGQHQCRAPVGLHQP